MASTALSVPEYPFGYTWPTRNQTAEITIDADGEKAAVIIPVPKSGTLDEVSFLTTTVTTGDDVNDWYREQYM